MKPSTRAHLLLTLTALVWGVAFVAQDVAADRLEPFTFNALRMALGALSLLPLLRARAARAPKPAPENRRALWVGGTCCGAMLMLGSAFQQMGIAGGTGAGKAGFITALYIVLVPLLGLLSGRRVRALTWLAVALAAGGLYLLCMRERFAIAPGDGLLLLCALSFAGHILVVDFFSRRVDCLRLSCLQFAVCAALCAVAALLWESPSWADVRACAVPILYAGVISCGVGYTLQTVGQKDTSPTIASLLMSLESVFAVAAGWLILDDALTLREGLGCAAMMGAIVLAQLQPQTVPQRQA